jgi:hypothetical protein
MLTRGIAGSDLTCAHMACALFPSKIPNEGLDVVCLDERVFAIHVRLYVSRIPPGEFSFDIAVLNGDMRVRDQVVSKRQCRRMFESACSNA